MASGYTTVSPIRLQSFEYRPRTQIVFGRDSFLRLGEIVCEYGGTRVLLVTDTGVSAAGHTDRACRMLQEAGLQVRLFDGVTENPTTIDVDHCVRFAREQAPDLIVGLGGGSCMDCAKGANFVLSNGGRIEDYRGVGRAARPMLPMIAVPTTAGTGSEAQSFAIIADPETHMKIPCGDPGAACRAAILDPLLTLTMPHSVCTATGVDAMTHAVESYVTTRRNPVSQMFALRAWTLLAESFPRVLENPMDVEARGRMQLGAHFAGAAIENSMLGAAHALANPLTAHYSIVHGQAVGLFLPHVIRWNTDVVGELYRDLAVAVGWAERDDPADVTAEVLAGRFTELLQQAQMPVTMSEGVGRGEIAQFTQTLAEQATQQWTGTFNPRKMDEVGFLTLYRNAL